MEQVHVFCVFIAIFLLQNYFLQISGGFNESIACIFISHTDSETVFTWNKV